MINIAEEAILFDLYYGKKAADSDSEEVPVADVTTPQFRDISISDVVCRGARKAITLQGLPEMPIRGIHLRNVSLTAANGATCTDAQDITFDHVEILNQKGPALIFTDSHDIRVDHFSYAPGAEAVFKLSGDKNAGITVKDTDLKAAAQDVILSDGATRDALKIE